MIQSLNEKVMSKMTKAYQKGAKNLSTSRKLLEKYLEKWPDDDIAAIIETLKEKEKQMIKRYHQQVDDEFEWSINPHCL